MGAEVMGHEAPPRWLGRLELALVVVAGALVLALVSGRLLHVHVRWTDWSDRDLARSLGPLWGLPASGAELNLGQGARIPGGAQYLLLRALGAGAGDPGVVQRGLVALDAVGLAALVWATWRVAGRWAGALSALGYVSAPFVLDAVGQIWNPAPVPALASVGLALIVRACLDDRPRALWLWGPVAAVGLQHHMSWLPWAVLGTAVVAVVGPAGRWRALLVGLLLAALTYLPYLIEELALGGRNTLLLGAQPRSSAFGGTGSLSVGLSELWRVVGWVTGPAAGDHPEGVQLGPRSVLLLGLFVGALLAAMEPRRVAPRLGALIGVAGLVGVTLVASDRSLTFFSRYVVVFMPALCLGGAAGLAAMARAFGPAPRAFVWVAVTGALLSAARPGLSVWTTQPGAGWPALRADLEAARAVSGPTFAELAARTVVVHGPDRSPAWVGRDGVSYLLAQEGTSFPGSSAPPCQLLLRDHATPDSPDALVRRMLPLVADQVHVLDVLELDARLQLLRYDGVDRCPTSMTQRYVEDPADEALHTLVEAPVAHGEVRRVVHADGVAWLTTVPLAGATVGDGQLLYLQVRMSRVSSGWRATLRSPQLSGEAHLNGWYVSALARAPRLVVRGADGSVVELPFSTGPVGFRSAVTPLSVDLPATTGPAVVSFRATLVEVGTAWPPSDGARTSEVDITLESGWAP